ncbi:MAG: HEAT repeat domain-containing protein [Planctomycetota bacterium]
MRTTCGLRLVGVLTGLGLCLTATARADDFITGDAAASWAKWQPATQAILDRNSEQAESFFGELLELEPSPFRIALLADRTITRTALGGALLLLEQDYANDALEDNGKEIARLLELGREQMNEADDGWYFCAIGRFDVAHANFRSLLGADPDPVALLEFTDRVKRRRDILLQLTDNPVVGESVQAVLKLLDRGEELVKADPTRIKERIKRLGGPPRMYENSVALLKQSGEYAPPFMVQYLRDPAEEALTQPILRCLPQIDRPALNPLVIALRMEDHVVKAYIVEALGRIGYPQTIPYLLQLRSASGTTPEVQTAVNQALSALAQRGLRIDESETASSAFFKLARGYYADQPSLAADPRLDTANIWYWRDDLLQNIEVPTQIFNEIMCMRCCEEALLLDPNLQAALALWVAADFRREAQLRDDEVDRTRPDNYPSAAYFAQTAGPGVCLKVLALALDDGDPAVALGAIQALHNTAGPASVVVDADGRLPLAEALSFPDRMVRIRAGLTLGNARPTETFLNYQNLMPVLSEALMLSGGARNALVVDPDAESANRIAGLLRDAGFETLTDAELFRGLQKVRENVPSLDAVFLASDIQDADLAQALTQLRAEFRFASTPVLIISKAGDREEVRDLVRADHRLAEIMPEADAGRILEILEKVSKAVGVTAITPELGTSLALEAAATLRLLAVTDNPMFDVSQAQPALISAVSSKDAELRVAAANVLGFDSSAAAQEAIAQVALDEGEAEEMRVAMFEALAEAAKHRGNQLGDAAIGKLISIAEGDENLVIRTAASQALGALNLPANKGSEIIRNQYSG